MTKIESNKEEIQNSAERVFAFLSDFNNFKSMMPPQVTNWTSTENNCSFTISGMATIGMKITDKQPHSLIKISSDGKVPFEFTLDVLISKTGENTCTGQLVFNANLNPMLRMMAEKPLSNFFNMLAARMKDIK